MHTAAPRFGVLGSAAMGLGSRHWGSAGDRGHLQPGMRFFLSLESLICFSSICINVYKPGDPDSHVQKMGKSGHPDVVLKEGDSQTNGTCFEFR